MTETSWSPLGVEAFRSFLVRDFRQGIEHIERFEHQNSDRNSVTIQDILSDSIGRVEKFEDLSTCSKLFSEILKKIH